MVRKLVLLLCLVIFGIAPLACAPKNEAPASSILAALSEVDDGVIVVDIDLEREADQSEPLDEPLGETHAGSVGYQLAGVRGVVSEQAPRRPRTLASVTKVSTALAALRNVPGVKISGVSEMLRSSHNYMAAVLLRRFAQTVAKIVLPPARGGAHSCPADTSSELLAAREVLKWLSKVISVDWSGASLADGSGCHPSNKMTPEQLVAILRYADSLGTVFEGRDFPSLLASPGTGTLRSRLKDLGGHARVYAKTGTLSSAITLAGYLFVPKGKEIEKYYFAVLIDTTNGVSKAQARRTVDSLVRGWARQLAL